MSEKHEPEPNWLFDEEAYEDRNKRIIKLHERYRDPDDPEPVDDR